MKKLRVVFLFVFLAGCSSVQNEIPAATPGSVQTSAPLPAQTAIPATPTLPPAPTPIPTITPTARGGGGGRIAFTSERSGAPEIYLMDPDGSDVVQLANDITPQYAPSWSPDGSRIAFATNDSGSASLYIMNADGSHPVKLIDTKEINTYDQATSDWQFGGEPVWSPDGRKIAFRVSYYRGCCYTGSYLHVVNVEGGGFAGSTALPTWERFAWSPDGEKLAFGSGCGGWSICVMNADGTDLIKLTKSNAIGGWPVWSPDGKRIAFASSRNGTSDIFVMNADGTNLVDLTNNNNAADGDPVWSPDGEKITFTSIRDDGAAIYVMNADGTHPVNLTSNLPAAGRSMVWSPDSTQIAFVSDVGYTSEIYVVGADGSALVRLTNNDVNDYSPVWSP